MRKIIFTLGLGFALLIVSCAPNSPEDEIQSTLPDPDVKVIVQSTSTTAFDTVPTPTIQDIVQTDGPVMAFGMESHAADFQDHAPLLGEPGLTLMRHNGLLWHAVEPVEGERDWSVLSELEGNLERAAASGLSTILIVRGTPEWAQLTPGH